MQNNHYRSMKELGRAFGVSSHKIGRMLKDLGLRTEKGKPSRKAFQEGYVTQRWAEERFGVYMWVWHAEKTAAVLERAGLKQVDHEAAG